MKELTPEQMKEISGGTPGNGLNGQKTGWDLTVATKDPDTGENGDGHAYGVRGKP
jgi:hypothetical protein